MVYWFKQLPSKQLDASWKPYKLFLPQTVRDNFQKYVNILSNVFEVIFMLYWILYIFIVKSEEWHWRFELLMIYVRRFYLRYPVLVIHELLHIIVIHKLGDYNITSYRKGWRWIINPDIEISSTAEMSKKRSLLWFALPFIMLSLMPFAISFFFDGVPRYLFVLISLCNFTMSPADIINMVFVLRVPKKSTICAGYYKINNKKLFLKRGG